MSDKLGKMITNFIEVEKNGVKVVIKQQYDKEINDINIDFSEHDKVFENKIAELKKDYETVSELLGKYQQENESLKKRVVELEDFSCQAEQETESLVEKLNQRIAGLEKELEEWKEEARVVKKQRDEQLKSFRKGIEPYVDLLHMHETIAELKQRISELESKETETCEKEPTSDNCRPSMEWYDNRHQSDCIEINRLNTTIDVLIHKVECLRQIAGLE